YPGGVFFAHGESPRPGGYFDARSIVLRQYALPPRLVIQPRRKKGVVRANPARSVLAAKSLCVLRMSANFLVRLGGRHERQPQSTGARKSRNRPSATYAERIASSPDRRPRQQDRRV